MVLYTPAELDAIAEPLLSVNKSLNLGPFIIAIVLDALFLGIIFMQCGNYFSRFRDDTPLHRGLVGYVLTMNTAITLLSWAWIYDLFVLKFGSYGLFLSIKYISWFYVLDSCTTIVVQGFFAWRAFLLTKKNYIVLISISLCMTAAFIGGIGVKVRFNQLGSTLYAGDLKDYAYVWLIMTVIADLGITVIIMTALLTKKTGWKTTDNLVTRLVRLTFESQLPPTLVALGLMTEYSVQYSSFIAIPFLILQPKFYAFSILHTLNSRETLATPGNHTINTVTGVQGGTGSDGWMSKDKMSKNGFRLRDGDDSGVTVTTDRYTTTETYNMTPIQKFSNRRDSTESITLDDHNQAKSEYGSQVKIVRQGENLV